MRHEQPIRPGGDDTQEDWDSDLFAALETQSAEDEDDSATGLSEAEEERGGRGGGAGAPSLPSVEQRAPYALEAALQVRLTPRSYQREAVDAWLRSGGRGVVVLPTGAGLFCGINSISARGKKRPPPGC